MWSHAYCIISLVCGLSGAELGHAELLLGQPVLRLSRLVWRECQLQDASYLELQYQRCLQGLTGSTVLQPCRCQTAQSLPRSFVLATRSSCSALPDSFVMQPCETNRPGFAPRRPSMPFSRNTWMYLGSTRQFSKTMIGLLHRTRPLLIGSDRHPALNAGWERGGAWGKKRTNMTRTSASECCLEAVQACCELL